MDALSGVLKVLRGTLKVSGKKASGSKAGKALPECRYDCVSHPQSEYFSLGFAKHSILPHDIHTKKYYIAGYQPDKPARGVLDAPHTHAVWLDDLSGRGGIVLVSIDDVGMLNFDVNEIRRRLHSFVMLTGCRSVNIVSTHSHAGIDTMGIWGKLPLTGRDKSYMELVFNATVKAVEAAYANRRKGSLYLGRVEVPDMQEDIRLPVVYSKDLTRLRFVPADGGKEVYILNFASHSESLQGSNYLVSADFPCYLREEIAEKTGAHVLYCVGAIGGMISMEIKNEREIKDAGSDFSESTKAIGRKLAQYALSIKPEDETKLAPKIGFIRKEFYFETDNTVLMLAAKAGIIKAREYHIPSMSLSHALKSEMSYFEIDSLKVLMLPCELFPELAYGGYLTADCSATGLGAEVNPEPLCSIAKDEKMMIIGLANDEVGYVIPPNDFLLHDARPYIEHARDRLDRRHYEETNSLGPNTAPKIAEVFKEMLKQVEKSKNM